MRLTFGILVFTFSIINVLGQKIISDFEGTWKYENKDVYEEWILENENSLFGISYKLVNGEKKISENLKLIKSGNQNLYQAQVLNQNNAQWITFELNPKVKEKLSFENSNHDFPKKIQYTFINSNKILVEVLGEDDKGFSVYLIKIDE